MSENLKLITNYIIDNFVYGSRVNKSAIDSLFKKYPIDINEKKIIHEELVSMNITLIQNQKSFVERLEKLFKLFNSNRELNEKELKQWYKNECINDKLQFQINKYLQVNGYTIINNRTQIIDKSKFDFLDDIEDFNDLDEMLDDDEFKKDVSNLDDVVNKSNNTNYLIEYHSDYENSLKKSNAMDKLVKANSKLVWKIVLRYKKLSTIAFDLEDMYQAGMQGLIKAVEKFDLSLEFQFSTYATHWIRQSITRGIANYSTAIRIPVHMREKITKFIRLENEYWNSYGHIATDEELAELMESNTKEINELKIYKEFSNLTSLETSVGDDGSSMLGQFISDENTQSPEKYIEKKALKKEVQNLFNERLTKREANVLILRFGLEDEKCCTLEEIGCVMGVTRERIRQIEAKAIKKLQSKNILERLGDFYNDKK